MEGKNVDVDGNGGYVTQINPSEYFAVITNEDIASISKEMYDAYNLFLLAVGHHSKQDKESRNKMLLDLSAMCLTIVNKH